MSLTAEFRLQSPRLPLIDVAAAVPELTFHLESAEQPRSGPTVFFIRVTGSSFDGVDTALTESSSVEEYFLISEVGSIRMYQLVLDGPRPASLDKRMFHKTFPESVTIRPDGWRIKQQFANRDELTTYREFWRTMDFSFRLDRLYDSHSTDAELIGLSDKQREALLTAYEEGYFAVPQQTSLDDIAAALDISRSALAERLHRAEAHLIEHFFYTDLY
jgi:predicted DNA binding protein